MFKTEFQLAQHGTLNGLEIFDSIRQLNPSSGCYQETGGEVTDAISKVRQRLTESEGIEKENLLEIPIEMKREKKVIGYVERVRGVCKNLHKVEGER